MFGFYLRPEPLLGLALDQIFLGKFMDRTGLRVTKPFVQPYMAWPRDKKKLNIADGLRFQTKNLNYLIKGLLNSIN